MKFFMVIGFASVFFSAVSMSELLSEEEAIAIGGAASKKLLVGLKGELTQAISSQGLVHAIDVCSAKAGPLSKSVSTEGLPKGVTVKRTSFKYRNVLNAPDSAEQAALHFFKNALSSEDALPQFLLKNEEGVYRYYKPLKVSGMCMSCHGGKDDVPEQVAKRLDELYPNDKARGYAVGDFRGLVTVTIPATVHFESADP